MGVPSQTKSTAANKWNPNMAEVTHRRWVEIVQPNIVHHGVR